MSEKKSLSAGEIVMGRTLSRRSITMLGAAVTGSLATLGIVSTTACCFGGMGGAGTGCSDNDPSDGLGRGTHCTSTGCSDMDPGDGTGSGTHCVASGCTDADPSDGMNSGRNCGGTPAGSPVPPTVAPPVGARRSCSDSDPNDPAGAGRTC